MRLLGKTSFLKKNVYEKISHHFFIHLNRQNPYFYLNWKPLWNEEMFLMFYKRKSINVNKETKRLYHPNHIGTCADQCRFKRMYFCSLALQIQEAPQTISNIVWMIEWIKWTNGWNIFQDDDWKKIGSRIIKEVRGIG